MRRALLIGAGFSYDLGMCLAADVTDTFLKVFDTRRAKRFAEILARNDPYGEGRPIDPTAIRAGMDLLLEYKASTGRNYEEFLARLESHPWKTQPERDSGNYLFSVFYGLLHRILVGYQVHSFEILYGLNQRWFSDLETLLSDEGETWVFSLNHDLYVECLAIDLGLPVTYGDTGGVEFPVSNLNLADKVRLTSSPRKNLSQDGPGWFSGARGINLVRLHGGFAELEYEDRSIICNPSLQHSSSSELMAEFRRVESMGYFARGGWAKFGGRDRVITNTSGELDIIRRTVLTGGKKYSKTTNPKPGEEKLQLFDEVLQSVDELTVVGYSFSDGHINHRVSNAMVRKPSLRAKIVDPSMSFRLPSCLEQFDYGSRLHRAYSPVTLWMSYLKKQQWDVEQKQALDANASRRADIKAAVEATLFK